MLTSRSYFVVCLIILCFTLNECSSSTTPSGTGKGDVSGIIYLGVTHNAQDGYVAKIDLTSGVLTTLVRGSRPNILSDKRILMMSKSSDGLVIVSADGTQEQLIVPYGSSEDYKRGFENPQISSDGKYIAYGNVTGTSYNVYVVDMTGKLLLTIGDATASYERPVWGPDGSLYFAGETNYTSGIFRIDNTLTITSMKRIDPAQNYPGMPAVNSAGTKIAYVVGGHVWTMGTDGSKATQFTTSNGTESYPVWSPDGKWIATFDGGGDVVLVPVGGGSNISLANKWSPNIFQLDLPFSGGQMDWK